MVLFDFFCWQHTVDSMLRWESSQATIFEVIACFIGLSDKLLLEINPMEKLYENDVQCVESSFDGNALILE